MNVKHQTKKTHLLKQKPPLSNCRKHKKGKASEELTDQQDSPNQPLMNFMTALIKQKESATPKPDTTASSSEAGPSKQKKPSSKSDKGKKKQVSELEGIVSDSDSEMDVELVTGFEILEMDRQMTIGEKRPNNLVMSFEVQLSMYFSDHMAPFRPDTGVCGSKKKKKKKKKKEKGKKERGRQLFLNRWICPHYESESFALPCMHMLIQQAGILA